ncbi:hypothetical protein WJX72_012504 [[Myrmecia] bisecta]|uniref:Uncharacterized protein n=1 Tax=[Myrmecia] bisecta TaxID=41462 RepID=A0AAW1R9Q5_9CHLO
MAAYDTWCNTVRERDPNGNVNFALDTPGTMAKFLSWLAEVKIAGRHKKQKATPAETGRNAIKHGVEVATRIGVWQGFDTLCAEKKDGGMFARHDLVVAVRRKYTKLVELQSTVAGIDTATHTKGVNRHITSDEKERFYDALWNTTDKNIDTAMAIHAYTLLLATVGSRDHEIRKLYLNHFRIATIDGISPATGTFLMLIMRGTKGTADEHGFGMLRHSDPMRCGIGGLARYLVYRNDIKSDNMITHVTEQIQNIVDDMKAGNTEDVFKLLKDGQLDWWTEPLIICKDASCSSTRVSDDKCRLPQ